MKKFIIAACAAIFSTLATAQSSGVEVKIETLVTIRNEARANFSVKNDTGQNLPLVFVDCTFFDGEEKPFKTQVAIVNNIAAGQKAFGSASIINPKVVKSADCRFSRAG